MMSSLRFLFLIIIISSVRVSWLVLTYDLLQDGCIDDIIFVRFLFFIKYVMFNTIFHVAVCRLSNRQQETSKCGKNIGQLLQVPVQKLRKTKETIQKTKQLERKTNP